LIDTHSHIYSEEFDLDRRDVVSRAKKAGVEAIVLPNIDAESLPLMYATEAENDGYCFAAIGLHPTSVGENYKKELALMSNELSSRKFIAIGEVGMDLYWDKTYVRQQAEAFRVQIEWSLKYDLPLIIHVRDAFAETMEAMFPYRDKGLRGVFHSFAGTAEQAAEMFGLGDFYLGINGIVTFKNSGLASTLPHIDLKRLLIETDAPYLAPVPFRGKRNESSYVKLVAGQLGAIYRTSTAEIDRITTENARTLFRLP